MKIDARLETLDDVAGVARALEAAGYDGICSVEIDHDPFLPLAIAATATERATLSTSIAVAFARTPMIVAALANDLQLLSRGRMCVGLGTQVRAHIEKRFSMEWSKPAARMREFVLALHAIWDCWEHGTKLSFVGEFYTHTLMSPFFSPGPHSFGRPRVAVAAVGDRMTEVAGEVADGVILHPFSTLEYIRAATLPALERGLASRGRDRDGFEVNGGVLVAVGHDDAAIEAAREALRAQLAFYGSTPAYRPVLDVHGWGDLNDELGTLARRADFDAMRALVSDEVVDAFGVTGTPSAVARELAARYDGVLDRLTLFTPEGITPDPELAGEVLDCLRFTER